jgi:hypothetical protein
MGSGTPQGWRRVGGDAGGGKPLAGIGLSLLKRNLHDLFPTTPIGIEVELSGEMGFNAAPHLTGGRAAN